MRLNQAILVSALTILTPILLLILNGCSLLPYDSDYSCAYSEGYGKCLSARDNYELSQMSENERSRYLGKANSVETSSNYSYCDRLRESCGCPNNECFDFETLQSLNRSGCLTPSEIIALENHEALLYIERLLLDRRAIEHRTPSDKSVAKGDSNANEDLINANGKQAKVVIADAGLDYGDSDSVNNRPLSQSCDYPNLKDGDTIRVEVYRAWLRKMPNAAYPVDNGFEAKRGDQYAVKGSKCGWVELDNGRYIHQSIVSVINKELNND
ncbi:MAG: hypothetical protein LBF86_08650 [Helicobacteraceae bacterium]|jgi:hypothetical protein|nr:hypothetical protein [Helicobacteraceae bacterium]